MQRRRADRQRAAAARRSAVLSAVGLLIIALMSVASVVGLTSSHHRAEAALEDRYATRTALAAAAAATYVSQLMDSEQRSTVANLTTGIARFPVVVGTFGFSAAVLLDSHGRLLAVYPPKPALLGKQISVRYPHLAAAVAGRRAISPVVASAATGEPVVGFAVPFNTPSGRRVFSGAYAVSKTPLQGYLRAMVSLRTSRFFLVDDESQVLASSATDLPKRSLQAVDPALYRAYRGHRHGRYGDQNFVTSPVPGTPWTVVAAILRQALLAPLNGPAQYTSWLILAGLIISATLVWLLLRRRYDDNLRLRLALTELDRVSRQDGLTGAHTRRSTGERLAEARKESIHKGNSLSVLMADVDHFKRINDTFGHLAGDDALIAVASRLQAGLRQDEILGRWGGEEFLIVLPDTDAVQASAVAERLRAAVAADPISLGTGGDAITVTISVGVSSSKQDIPEVLVHKADRAMYAAKSDGRNRVWSIGHEADSAPHTSPDVRG